MITVTLGEAKTQEKPFPKLMISNLGQIILAIGTNEKENSANLIVGVLIVSNGYPIGGNAFTKAWDGRSFTDYNEPITIQNA